MRCRGLQVEVERYPRPSCFEVDILYLAAGCSEDDRFRSAAPYTTVRKGDGRTRCEIQQFAGRSLPELEADLLVGHCLATLDSKEHLGDVGQFIVRHVRHTDALAAIECINYVLVIGVVLIADFHLSTERHVERILTFIYSFVRRVGIHGKDHFERFTQALFVGQIDDIRVLANRYIDVVIDADCLIFHRVNGSVGRADGQPVGHGLDGVLMPFAGVVDDLEIDIGRAA